MEKEKEVISEENIVYLGENNLNINKMIHLLTAVSRKKQKDKKS